jgi:hypothetical protein
LFNGRRNGFFDQEGIFFHDRFVGEHWFGRGNVDYRFRFGRVFQLDFGLETTRKARTGVATFHAFHTEPGCFSKEPSGEEEESGVEGNGGELAPPNRGRLGGGGHKCG